MPAKKYFTEEERKAAKLAKAKIYRDANLDKVHAQEKASRDRHKEAYALRKSDDRKSRPEVYKQRHLSYSAKPETKKLRHEYYLVNQDRIKAKSLARYNAEHGTERVRRKFASEDERREAQREWSRQNYQKKRTGNPIGAPSKYATKEERKSATALRKKEWAKKNAERLKEKRKIYYEFNREQLQAKQKARIASDPHRHKSEARRRYRIHSEKRRSYARKRYWANVESSRAAGRRYQETYKSRHPEEYRAKLRSYYLANQETIKNRSKNWRIENANRYKAWQRSNYSKNRDQIREYQRALYEKNRDRYLATQKKWARANAERIREANATWKLKNPDKVKANARLFCDRHRDEIRKKSRLRYKEQREIILARLKLYRQQKPESRRATCGRYYAANKDKVVASNLAWRIANPQKVTLINRRAANRRRFRLKGQFSSGEWRELLAICGHKCVRCGVTEKEAVYYWRKGKAFYGSLTFDHIIPLEKDGWNVIDNIQPLCMPCQLWKRVKIIDYRPRAARIRFPFVERKNDREQAA